MNVHPDFKGGFEHPDPEYEGPYVGDAKDKKVDFCKYWGVSQV
jgi:hypothetical protein